MIVTLPFILLCMLVAGFYAGSETGAYRLNRVRLRSDAEAGSRLARLTRRVVSDMERFICLTLAAQNIAMYGATVLCTALFEELLRGRSVHHSDLYAELASTLILAPVMLLVVDVIPKSLYQVIPNPLMRWSSPALWLTDKLLWPVITLLLAVVSFGRMLFVRKAAPRQTVVTTQYLHSLLSAGAQEGVITPQQDSMVRNIMQLSSVPVKKIMTPLSQVRVLSIEAGGAPVAQDIARFNHARLPVYEGAPAHIVGILRVLDYLCEGEGGPIRPFVREAIRIPSGAGMDSAFRRLQETGQPMAIVIDTQDRPIGVVTFDDLLQGILVSMGK